MTTAHVPTVTARDEGDGYLVVRRDDEYIGEVYQAPDGRWHSCYIVINDGQAEMLDWTYTWDTDVAAINHVRAYAGITVGRVARNA